MYSVHLSLVLQPYGDCKPQRREEGPGGQEPARSHPAPSCALQLVGLLAVTTATLLFRLFQLLREHSDRRHRLGSPQGR